MICILCHELNVVEYNTQIRKCISKKCSEFMYVDGYWKCYKLHAKKRDIDDYMICAEKGDEEEKDDETTE